MFALRSLSLGVSFMPLCFRAWRKQPTRTLVEGTRHGRKRSWPNMHAGKIRSLLFSQWVLVLQGVILMYWNSLHQWKESTSNSGLTGAILNIKPIFGPRYQCKSNGMRLIGYLFTIHWVKSTFCLLSDNTFTLMIICIYSKTTQKVQQKVSENIKA